MDSEPGGNGIQQQNGRDMSLSQLLHSQSVSLSATSTAHSYSVPPDIELFSLDQFQSYFCERVDVLPSAKTKHFLQPRQAVSANNDSPRKPQTRPQPKLTSVDLEGDPQDVEKDLALEKWWSQKRKQIKAEKALQKEQSQSKNQPRWPTEKHGRRVIIVFENMTPVDMINEALTIVSSFDPDSERVPSRFVILLAELERVRRIQQEKLELQNRLLKKHTTRYSSTIRHRYDWNQPHMDRPRRVQQRTLTQRPPKHKLRLSWNHTIYVSVAYSRVPKTSHHCRCLLDSSSKELTFTPNISRPPRGYKPRLKIWSRLYNHARQMIRRRRVDQELRRKQLQEQEVEGCTFSPELPSSPRRLHSEVDVIQRLHTVDLERRKAAWNELIRKTNKEIESICTFKPKIPPRLPITKHPESQSRRQNDNPDGTASPGTHFLRKPSRRNDKARLQDVTGTDADIKLHRGSRSCLL